MADRDGRLEDRPRRIKALVLPFDECDVDAMLNDLQSFPDPFVKRYEVDGIRYIQVVKSDEHFNPHPNEKHSVIPKCSKKLLPKVEALAKSNKPLHKIIPSSSLSLNPSSLNPYPPIVPQGGRMRFDDFWKTYPKRIGRKAAERHWQASVKTAVDVADICSALVNYLRSDDVKRGYVQNGSTWFNNWRDWVNYKGVEVAPIPKPLPKPAEVLPPDPTDDDLLEMHNAKVSALGKCRAGCETCEKS